MSNHGPGIEPDWEFLRRPFWLFSHLFAATVIVSFILLGFWQLNRHGERASLNEVIGGRSEPPALTLTEALAQSPDDAAASPVGDSPVGDSLVDRLDYQLVTATGSFEIDEVVRVGNRTQGGVAGFHVVGLFRTDSGQAILVNRGFVPLDPAAVVEAAPTGRVEISGWLRASATKGFFGAADGGTADVVPRLDVEAIAARLESESGSGSGSGSESGSIAPVWLQLQADESGSRLATFPDPAPLPPIDAGPHLGYMAQWFIFVILGVGFYAALLRRTARHRSRAQPIEAAPVER